jgi:hypothetical protein
MGETNLKFALPHRKLANGREKEMPRNANSATSTSPADTKST